MGKVKTMNVNKIKYLLYDITNLFLNFAIFYKIVIFTVDNFPGTGEFN